MVSEDASFTWEHKKVAACDEIIDTLWEIVLIKTGPMTSLPRLYPLSAVKTSE